MSYRMGIDIGGTFTDFALIDDRTGMLTIHKQLTTPSDPSVAVLDGAARLLRRAGLSFAELGSIIHGSTLVTNAVIERRGAVTGMLVTEGFSDVLDIAMERRYDIYDLRLRFPAPIIPRAMRAEIAERMQADGSVATALDPATAVARVGELRERHGIVALVQTSFSSIVRESYDLAYMIFDASGQMMAQGMFSQPVFIGTGPQTLRYVLASFPTHTLRPGDVLLTNDAWYGTGHLWDVNVIRPIFRIDVLIGYAMTFTHLPDIGGRGYSALNASIYEEGLQIPPVKLISGGVLDSMLMRLIRQNVRVSEQVVGDLMANVSATEVGARLVLEFMADYQLTSLDALANAVVGQSERAMRAGVTAIGDGSYANSIQVEAPGQSVTLACRIDVSGDRLSIDFSGTSPQLASAVNVPLCYTRAMACYALKCLLAPNIPNNDGSVRPVELSAPEGCILHAQRPAATGARMGVGHFVVPLVFGALTPAIPDKTPADPGMINSLTVVGRDRNHAPFSTLFFSAGGLGALAGLDGNSATPAPANIMTMPAETWETLTGMRVLARRLRPDSGGAGEFRGVLGQEIILQNHGAEPIGVAIIGSRTEFRARGIVGGRDGAPRIFELNGAPLQAKGNYQLEHNDILKVADAGGGGYGEPRLRDRQRIAADVAEGFVTLDGARRDYGFDG